jgi:hypothetical protein
MVGVVMAIAWISSFCLDALNAMLDVWLSAELL